VLFPDPLVVDYAAEDAFCNHFVMWLQTANVDDLSHDFNLEAQRLAISSAARSKLPVDIPESASNADVFAYFRERARGESKEHHIKLMLLGDGGEGKTLLLRRLMNLTPGPAEVVSPAAEQVPAAPGSNATDGVDVHEWVDPEHPNLHLHCFDFGGQQVYELTHPLFFTRNCIVLLVHNLRKNRTGQLTKWWWSLLQHLGLESGVCVIPVLTQCNDVDASERCVPHELAGLQLVEPVAFVDSGERATGIAALRERVLDVAEEMVTESKSPGLYIRVMRAFLTAGQRRSSSARGSAVAALRASGTASQPWWNSDELPQRLTSAGAVVSTDMVPAIVRYCVNAGAVLWFEEVDAARELVFLRPQVVMDAAAALVTYKRASASRHGRMFVDEALRLIGKRTGVVGEAGQRALLAVLSKLDVLVYTLYDDSVLIPGLITAQPPAGVVDWVKLGRRDAAEGAVLARQLHVSDYLSSTFVHRVMVRLYREALATSGKVVASWRDGIDAQVSGSRIVVHADVSTRVVFFKTCGALLSDARVAMRVVRGIIQALVNETRGMHVEEHVVIGLNPFLLREVEAVARGADHELLTPEKAAAQLDGVAGGPGDGLLRGVSSLVMNAAGARGCARDVLVGELSGRHRSQDPLAPASWHCALAANSVVRSWVLSQTGAWTDGRVRAPEFSRCVLLQDQRRETLLDERVRVWRRRQRLLDLSLSTAALTARFRDLAVDLPQRDGVLLLRAWLSVPDVSIEELLKKAASEYLTTTTGAPLQLALEASCAASLSAGISGRGVLVLCDVAANRVVAAGSTHEEDDDVELAVVSQRPPHAVCTPSASGRLSDFHVVLVRDEGQIVPLALVEWSGHLTVQSEDADVSSLTQQLAGLSIGGVDASSLVSLCPGLRGDVVRSPARRPRAVGSDACVRVVQRQGRHRARRPRGSCVCDEERSRTSTPTGISWAGRSTTSSSSCSAATRSPCS
jgi:GTPase SAR1 family protein